MVKILIGTRNNHKLSEILNLLSELKEKFEFLSLKDFTNMPDVKEDGKTIEENAIKKAKVYASTTGIITISEDTSLEVEYLKGLPGVYSARFAGPGCTYEDNNKKLLFLLKDVPYENRKAKFRCVVALISPENINDSKIFKGEIEGYISTEPKGETGFGYDPVFIVPEYNKTFAELGKEIKNKISHRAIAFNKLKMFLWNDSTWVNHFSH